jgi:tryptophan synthase alpha chain
VYLEEFKPIMDNYHLPMILLITPETPEERIRLIDSQTNSFIYMVSSASTTGAQHAFNEEKTAYFQRIQAMNLKNPCLIGFGVSNQTTLQSAFHYASGAIIGSAFIECLQQSTSIKEAVGQLLERLSH